MGEFKEYPYNKKLEKELLDKWCSRKLFFNIWKVVVIVAWVVALLATVIWLIVLPKFLYEEFILLAIIMALIVPGLISIIPLVIWGVKLELRRIYGRPFEWRHRQYLRLYDSKLEYGFFYGDIAKDNGKKITVYSISYDKLKKITYDEKYKVLTFTGIGELSTYIEGVRGRAQEKIDGRKFYEDSDFSFILCFDQYVEVLEKLEKLQNENDILFLHLQEGERNYLY